jgi:hypothetical protein
MGIQASEPARVPVREVVVLARLVGFLVGHSPRNEEADDTGTGVELSKMAVDCAKRSASRYDVVKNPDSCWDRKCEPSVDLHRLVQLLGIPTVGQRVQRIGAHLPDNDIAQIRTRPIAEDAPDLNNAVVVQRIASRLR